MLLFPQGFVAEKQRRNNFVLKSYELNRTKNDKKVQTCFSLEEPHKQNWTKLDVITFLNKIILFQNKFLAILNTN